MDNLKTTILINLGIGIFFVIGAIYFFKKYTNFSENKETYVQYFKELFKDSKPKDKSNNDNNPIKKK